MSDLPEDYPLRMDIQAIAGHATSEYELSPEEIGQTLREMANRIEEDRMLKRMYLGANRDRSMEKNE